MWPPLWQSGRLCSLSCFPPFHNSAAILQRKSPRVRERKSSLHVMKSSAAARPQQSQQNTARPHKQVRAAAISSRVFTLSSSLVRMVFTSEQHHWAESNHYVGSCCWSQHYWMHFFPEEVGQTEVPSFFGWGFVAFFPLPPVSPLWNSFLYQSLKGKYTTFSILVYIILFLEIYCLVREKVNLWNVLNLVLELDTTTMSYSYAYLLNLLDGNVFCWWTGSHRPPPTCSYADSLFAFGHKCTIF